MKMNLSNSVKKPPILKVIAALIFLTIFRVQTILFIPKVTMFGGIAPNGWLGPWASDFILGLFVPLVVWFVLKGRGMRMWALLILYNSVGAFDYSQGLVTQWVSPMPEVMASQAAVYLGIGVFMLFQLIALVLLFRTDVIFYFSKSIQ